MMSRSPVELCVGGQTYRVVASAEEAELQRLAHVVDKKLRELSAPSRYIPSQTILLAATEEGLGGCMIGNISRGALVKALEMLADHEVA